MPSNSRRAQGMSLNVIIIAVIALAVLVVLLFIFVGKSRVFGSATSDCAAKGGSCMAPDECDPDVYARHYGAKCEDEDAVCCARMVGSEDS